MTNMPEQLQSIARDVARQIPAPSVTVREFLSWFLAERRGYSIVSRIRSALESAKLITEPDFESAFIDSPITFKPASAIGVAAIVEGNDTAAANGASNVATAPIEPQATTRVSDPTYRISKLKAANGPITTINQDAPAEEAVTLMLLNDFSQLPVMQGDRTVKGVISWQSIGSRLAFGKGGPLVKDLMDTAQEVRADLSIFHAIPIIAQHQYVLVRGADNRISGILTSADLNFQFQQLAEPFLQLGEIENHIRRLIDGKFSAHELSQACDPADSGRVIEDVSSLSFGEYIRLVENPDRWGRLGLPIDRKSFCAHLENVRVIRNDVMHFDPDGITLDNLERLRDVARFLQRLQSLGIT